MSATLVIMAAGLASRYGGAKQIEKVGPGGEILMEYTIHDAQRAGFDRFVIILQPQMLEEYISIGTIGLIKAVNTYRSSRKVKLATYAARCIENEILMCLRASQKRKGDVSLQEPIGTDGEGNEITLIDVLGTDPEAVHGEVERRVSLQSIRELAEHGLKGREATVIRMRYGLMDGKAYAQQEVAERLGISRSYISRIEKKALERLKEAFETGKMSRKS